MKFLYHHRTQADDGQAVHIRSMQAALVQLGHEVQEVGLVSQGSGEAQAQSGRSRWGWITRMPRFARELAEYAYGPLGRQRILQAAAQFEPDLIYERYAFGNTAGVQAARRLGLPLVLEVNSPMVLELSRTRGLSFPGLARKVERFVFTEATRVCVVTEVLRDILLEEGVQRENLVVTPNGVHLDQYDYADRTASAVRAREDLGLPRELERPVLGFVGYYRDWHRLELAVESLVRPGMEEAHLCLIGDGPAGPSIAARAAQLGVSERVVFAGKRPHEAIPRLLPAFDLALVPAINPYASPLKLHEYMAAGVPTVAPRQPNLLEVLEHERDALLFTPGEGEELCASIERLVAEPELRRRLGASARQTIEARDLTWEGNVRRVLDALPQSSRKLEPSEVNA